ncbi:glycosyltransferase [Nodosilinea sp. LEGE 06152]|uniref:glycosyltransferase n=1 Tax=Nodosilinea sp. LEGE 06152 TaxID=2777966 RepID=UPI00187DDD7D|nr:glycosyltransferase [Nodosilinea sp. LEGE 06152]MBE9157906.1 glycosyltransferase [Nodosilinea sp. LEGE 06152]
MVEREPIDSSRDIWRIKLITRKLPFLHVLKYIEWIIRIIVQTCDRQVPVVHVHSLSALPAGMLFKWLRRAKLVYDAHELETESNGLTGNRKKTYKVLEKLFIPFADAVLVVGDAIADWYRKTYSLDNVHVVRNIPDVTSQIHFNGVEEAGNLPDLKRVLHVPPTETLFIYQGAIFAGRGIQILLEAFSQLPGDRHIVFMGYGELEDLVRNYAAQFSNIHFFPAVPPAEVLSYTRTADVGISLIENTCLSYYYCLPNKVFEYMAAGLPIIVSNFPEMARMVDTHGVGWKSSVDAATVIQLVQSLSPDDLAQARAQVLTTRQLYSWEFEQEKLIEVYQSVLGSR